MINITEAHKRVVLKKAINDVLKKDKNIYRNDLLPFYFALLNDISKNSPQQQYKDNTLNLKITDIDNFKDNLKYNEMVNLFQTYKSIKKIVIATGNPRLNYLYAEIFKGNVKPHGEVVIASKSPIWNFAFAKYISGADVPAHLQAIMNSKNEFWIGVAQYYFKNTPYKQIVTTQKLKETEKK